MSLPNPSANPRIILQLTSATRLPAKNGVTNVAMLHNRTLHINTFLAPTCVAQKLPKIQILRIPNST